MRSAAELPARGDADIAALASLLADPARCKVLLALDDGRALPASVLADEAGISRPTASSHLGKLTGARLLTVESTWQAPLLPAGRSRGRASCSSSWGASRRHGRCARCGTAPGRRDCARRARVTTMSLAALGWLSWAACWIARRSSAATVATTRAATAMTLLSSPGYDLQYELTDTGRGFLTSIGVEMPTGKRPLVRYCVDWTEQRHHLSGGLGRAVLDRFLSAGWVKRAPRGRALTVTDDGRSALADAFGIEWGA